MISYLACDVPSISILNSQLYKIFDNWKKLTVTLS